MPAVAVAVVWLPPGAEMGGIVPRGREMQGITRRRIQAVVAGVVIMLREREAPAAPEL